MVTRMDIENIKPIEIRQTQKDKYHMVPLYLYELPRVGKFIETERGMVVPSAGREGWRLSCMSIGV